VTNGTIKLTYILILGGLGLVVLFAAYLTRTGISIPLRTIATALEKLVQGDYDTEINGVSRKDEIGGFARAALVFRDQGRETARLRAEQAAARVRAEADKRAALTGMAHRIETEAGAAIQQIGERTEAMTTIAEKMHALASRTGRSAQGASGATGIALRNAQTVASAAEELAASIGGIRSQVDQSTAVVNKAVEASGVTRSAIEALDKRVERIGEMAKTIGDIAAKTNLLALNATIEAARAGDAGKGFAVVAGEVKQLATQTARSTLEINRHVGEVGAATTAAVAAVARIEATISEVNVIARSIAAAMEQQGASTSEIARNVTETASAVNDISARNDEVSREAEQAGHYADAVLENTTVLDTAIRDLKHTIIGIVRTSTSEVDRRMFERHKMDADCQVEVPGQGTIPARIVDISEGGAQLTEFRCSGVGTRGTLRVEGLAAPIAFNVISAQDEAVHLAFNVDETIKVALRAWLQSYARKWVA
jgi:methyl-accepting chemotaxis protein